MPYICSRTVFGLLASIIVFIAAYFIPNVYGSVAVLSLFGFILSLDIFGLFDQIVYKVSKQKSETLTIMYSTCKEFLWKWGWKEALFYSVMCLLSVGISVATVYLSTENDLSDIGTYLGLGAMGLVVLDILFSQLQTVYVMFGFIRNRLFPGSVMKGTEFRKQKKKLKTLGIIRRILMEFGKQRLQFDTRCNYQNYLKCNSFVNECIKLSKITDFLFSVAPFLMVAHLGLSLKMNEIFEDTDVSSNATSTKVIDMMGAARAFRWVSEML